MSMKSVSLTVALIALALTSVATRVTAASSSVDTSTTVSECKAMIDALILETQAVAISGMNAERNRTGLLGKLSNAEVKLDQGKFADAIQKLDDYEAKVSQLAASGSISAADANLLLSGADDAIACISQLG
jgi:hypothetical protein